MISANKFKDMALSMGDTDMASHFDKLAFKKHKKIFASLHPDTLVAMVKLSPEQQSVYLQLPDNIFYPATGTWGKNGYTLFHLSKVNLKIAQEVLKLAWENIP